MLACFTLGWIAGCSGSSSSATPDAGADTFEWAACPEMRSTPQAAGGCTLPDGGSIDTVTLPYGCEGPPSDGGASFDRTIFSGQPSLMVDDDDCKYRVVFTRACTSSSEMSFLVEASKRVDGSPATGGTPSIDAYQGLAHPAPNDKTVTSEHEQGTYVIGPVRFDRSGAWTLELHLYEQCAYGPGSPHGHAYFEIDIP